MATTKVQKKLPKRTGNSSRKAKFAASWKRGQARKEARRLAQEARHEANLIAGVTKWEKAVAARYARRHPHSSVV